MATHEVLGARIRRAYEEAGLNRSEFVRSLGVAYSTVLLWERGSTRPNMRNLRAVAGVTGVPVNQLLGMSKKPSKNKASWPHPALHEFLATPFGSGLSSDERRTVCEMVFHGVEPTMQSYHTVVLGIRLGVPGHRIGSRPRA